MVIKLCFELLEDFFDHKIGEGVLDALSDSLLNVQTNFCLGSHDIAMLFDKRPSVQFEVFHLVIENICLLFLPLLFFLQKESFLYQSLLPAHLVRRKISNSCDMFFNEVIFVRTSVPIHIFPLFADQVVFEVCLVSFNLLFQFTRIVLDLEVWE